MRCTEQTETICQAKSRLIKKILFIDLAKAFELVDHSILLKKLNNYRVRGVRFESFKNYLQVKHRSKVSLAICR